MIVWAHGARGGQWFGEEMCWVWGEGCQTERWTEEDLNRGWAGGLSET